MRTDAVGGTAPCGSSPLSVLRLLVPHAELASRHVAYLQQNPQTWVDHGLGCVGSFTVRCSGQAPLCGRALLRPSSGRHESLPACSCSRCGDVYTQPAEGIEGTVSAHVAAPRPMTVPSACTRFCLSLPAIGTVCKSVFTSPFHLTISHTHSGQGHSPPSQHYCHVELPAPHGARCPGQIQASYHLPRPRLWFGFQPGWVSY